MTAANEVSLSRPGSATAYPLAQDNAPSIPPENTSSVAGNLNQLEKFFHYTMPGVAISVARQEALYREYLHAQIQQYGSGQGVDQANSQSSCGVEILGNQGQTTVQNFAPPSLLPPMQSPRPPTPMLAPTKSSIFKPDPSTILLVNQFTDHS